MTKANWQMLISSGSLIIAALTFAYSYGVVNTKVERMETEHTRRIAQVEKKQETIGTVQVETAKQSVAIEDLKEDVREIKNTQNEISTAVEQSRREVNRLSQEQAENFQKLLEAVQ